MDMMYVLLYRDLNGLLRIIVDSFSILHSVRVLAIAFCIAESRKQIGIRLNLQLNVFSTVDCETLTEN